MKTLSVVITVLLCVLLLSGMAFGQKTLTWQSTSSTAWATAANWYDEGALATSTTAPASTDIVVVNNSRGASAQPSVTTAVACKQLTVGSGFLLTISGSSSTLTVGDNATGNNDILIQNGGEIDNNSTLASGVPLTLLNTSGSDKIRIDNGGKLVHNTPRSFGNGLPASQCDFDASSTVEFGTSAATALSLQGRVFGNLSISRSGSTGAFSSNSLTINGTLSVNTGGGLALTLTGTSTCAINNISTASGTTLSWVTSVAPLTITGNIVNNGTITNSTAVQTVTFNGNTAISGNAVVFTNGFTVNAGKTLAINQSTNILAASKTATINGTFQMNEGSYPGTNGTFAYNASTGTLVFNTTTSYGVNNDIYWPTTSGPANVTVQNSGGITMNVARPVAGVFQTSAGITNANNLTFNGTAKINAGGYFTGNPSYGGGSLLVYNSGGTYGRNAEWSSTTPASVQLSGNTALNYPNGGGSFSTTLTGNLTIDAGSALYMDYGSPGTGVGTLTVNGNVALNGSLSLGNQVGGDLHIGGNWTNAGTFAPQGRAVECNGSGAQSITGATSFDYLTVNKAAGTVTLVDNVTINNLMSITAGTLTTGSKKVSLGSSAGISEAGSGAIVIGTVEATRTLSGAGNQTFGGLGIELSPNAAPYPGLTTVTRVTGTAQTGGGNQSIARYYDVSPAVSSGLDLNLVFHYDNSAGELNSNDVSKLTLYRSADAGATWQDAGFSSRDNGSKTVTLNNVTSLSRWTAADSAHPMITAASMLSDIITAAGESSVISSLENTSSPLTSATGAQTWQLTVRDGGGTADPDLLPTQITAITLTQGAGNTVSNWSNAILAADLFSGSTHLAIGTVSASSIAFSGLSGVEAADDGNVTLSLRISLKNPLGSGILDNQKFVFTLNAVNATAGSGTVSSQFSSFSAPVSDNTKNAIGVVATALSFTTQPSDTAVSGISLARQPVVVASDANGNKDFDYAGTVTLTNSAALTMSGNAVAASSGTVTYSAFSLTGSGVGVTLSTTNTDGLVNATSNGMLIYAGEPTVQASALNFSGITGSGATLSWTNGNGASRLVIARSGSAVSTNPTDGTAYTANPAFSSGTAIGSGYVVYSGSGNSVTVTGLTSGTTYFFAVYEFNGTDGMTNYLSPGASAFATPGLIQSAATGNWSAPATWVGGVLPTSGDNVLISTGTTVTVDDASAACNSLTFGSATTSKIAFASASVLSVYGDFTLKSTTHNAISTWAAGAKLRFAGSAKQTLNGWNTSSSSTVTTCLMEVQVDKSGDTLKTPGTDMKLNIGTSLEIINGLFFLGTADDINGKTLDQTAGTTPTITVQSGGSFVMAGGASQIMTGSTGALPIGKMTVYGDVTLTTTSSNNAGFGGVDIENGGVVTLTTGWGTGRFNPGTVTVKAGGMLSNSGTTNLWIAGSSVVLNDGGTFRTYSSTTPMPPTLVNNGTVRYTRSTSEQTIVDMDYNKLEISYDSLAAPKRWTVAAPRVIADSLEVNNGSKLILTSASPQSVTVNGTVRLTTGEVDNSDPNVSLTLGNGAVISRATGFLAASPQFGSSVDVRYTSISGSVTTGPELPVASSVLGNLSVATTGQTVTLGANATVNDSLLLIDGKIVTGPYTLSVSPAGVTTRTAGYVVGTLRKGIPAGPSSRTFEIGDASIYSPVSIAFNNVTTPGDVSAYTTPTQHASIAGSGLNPAKSLTRYYTLANNGVVFDQYDAVFNFDAADVPSGSNTANFAAKKFTGGTWTLSATGVRTSTSTEATGLTSFGDFQIGELNEYTLDVSVTGEGSVQKTPEQAQYAAGTSVQLNAVPETGFHFAGWSGAASGSVNPLTLSMDSSMNISARFDIDTFTISASALHGTISPYGTVYAPYNSVAMFTLTADPHYHIDSVFVDGAYVPGVTTMYAFNGIQTNHAIYAKFAINTYSLTLNGVHGSIGKNPDHTSYNYGDTVRLTATPDPTYNFVDWSGDATGSANPVIIVMDTNKSVTANFSAETYALGVTVSGNGSVGKAPDQASYSHGAIVTLTAVPAPGSHFVNWTGDATGSTNPVTVTMDASKSVVAHFAPDAYTLTTAASNGTISKNPDSLTYSYGTSVQLTAVPATGYHFTNWTGDLTGSVNPASVTMNGNRSVTAHFIIDTLRITVLPVAHGSITPGTTDVTFGSDQGFTIIPDLGYHLDSVVVDGARVDSTTSYTFHHVTAAHTIGAHFSINRFTISASAAAHGTISPSGSVDVPFGDTLVFMVTPDAGYHHDSLIVDGVKVDTTSHYAFQHVAANHSIHAYFGSNTFVLTTSVVGLGSIQRNPDLANYTAGSTVQLTAVPHDNSWKFDGWSGAASGSANPVTVTMSAAKSVTATFVRDSAYLVTYRTFLSDSIALSLDNSGKLGKFVARKPVAVDFSFSVTMPEDGTIGLSFPLSCSGVMLKGADTVASWTEGKTIGFSTVFAKDDVVTFFANAPKAKPVKSVGYNVSGAAVIKGKVTSITNTLRLPMPNRLNALNEAMVAKTFGDGGIVIGYPEPKDSAKYYAWFQTAKTADLIKTLVNAKTGKLHGDPSHGFDYWLNAKAMAKQQKVLAPDKYNSKLLGDLIALKVSIAASRMGMTRVGFGELLFNDATSRFHGKMVKEIAALGDTLMMGWLADTTIKSRPAKVHKTASLTEYAEVDSVISRLNASFEGALDTVKFSDTLRFTGVRPLVDVSYLKANPGAIPATFAPVAGTAVDAQVPDAFALNQNYPNPFNPTTTIGFVLPQDSRVTVRVYNVLGQLVATLLDHEAIEAGYQEIQFNANNLASGVYFYRLTAEHSAGDDRPDGPGLFTGTKKMILIK